MEGRKQLQHRCSLAQASEKVWVYSAQEAKNENQGFRGHGEATVAKPWGDPTQVTSASCEKPGAWARHRLCHFIRKAFLMTRNAPGPKTECSMSPASRRSEALALFAALAPGFMVKFEDLNAFSFCSTGSSARSSAI